MPATSRAGELLGAPLSPSVRPRLALEIDDHEIVFREQHLAEMRSRHGSASRAPLRSSAAHIDARDARRGLRRREPAERHRSSARRASWPVSSVRDPRASAVALAARSSRTSAPVSGSARSPARAPCCANAAVQLRGARAEHAGSARMVPCVDGASLAAAPLSRGSAPRYQRGNAHAVALVRDVRLQQRERAASTPSHATCSSRARRRGTQCG